MLAGDVQDRWTLRAADGTLLGNKTGATRLGFAVPLELFQAEGRFPRRPEDVSAAAVEATAGQIGVDLVATFDTGGSLPTPDGFARIVVPGAIAGGRYVSNLASLTVFDGTAVFEPTSLGLLLAGLDAAGLLRRSHRA